MKICSFGKTNKNIDKVLPFLKDDLNKIPQEILEIAVTEEVLKYEDGKVLPGKKLINFKNISRDTILYISYGYFEIIRQKLDGIKYKFSKSELYSKGYTWDQMQHILIMALCIDHGILKYLYKSEFLVNETEDFYIWCFDLDFHANNAFGIKMWNDETNDSAICELWHNNKNTTILGISDSEKGSLSFSVG